MPLRVVCCFSHLTGPDGWQDSHHCVNQFLRAIKGQPLSGYAYVRVGPSQPRRKLEASNAGDAVDWFGDMAARVLLTAAVDAPALVPIPDSACTVGARRSRTTAMADAIAARVPGAQVADALRFDQVMHSSHGRQGCRDALSLHRHLTWQAPEVAAVPCVLVDDVITTGGHLAAAAAVLRQVGYRVDLAVCAVSAGRAAHPCPFDRVVRWVDDYVPASVWP
jgi:hypothetical protein